MIRAAARAALALGLLVPGAAHAQTFPAKPLRMVVPYPAGGPTDQLGRIFAEHMSQGLGQTVIVENRGGANTQIGTAEVTKAAPDGYTMLFGGITPFVFNPLMYAKLQYDPADLAGVAMAARSQLVLVAKPALPAKTVSELVALMKASPGKLNYGSSPPSSSCGRREPPPRTCLTAARRRR